MEKEIVASLGSYMYPQTAGSFCLMFLSGCQYDSMPILDVIDTCHFMIELAACGKTCSIALVPSHQNHAKLPSQQCLHCTLFRLLLSSSQAIQISYGSADRDNGANGYPA